MNLDFVIPKNDLCLQLKKTNCTKNPTSHKSKINTDTTKKKSKINSAYQKKIKVR